MTGTQLATIGGMMIAGGMVSAVSALRSAPPSLAAALRQLSAEPTTSSAVLPAPTTATGWTRLPDSVAAALDGHLGVSDADLTVIGWTRPQLATRKLMLAIVGFLAPSVIGVLMLVLGLGGLVALPIAAGVAIAAVGWYLPTHEVKELASKARAEFRTNLEFFLMLVAGERRARGSVEQALEEAVELSDSAPFVHMRRAIRRSALAGHKPWADLRALGEQLDVAELRNLADIAEVAADGAAVYNTLLASARTLRHGELSDQKTDANQVSERMSRPLALSVFGLTLFVLVPFMLRMLALS